MSEHFTPVSTLGEFGIIQRMSDRLVDLPRSSNLIEGIGDDAAVYKVGEGTLHVITTDALIEGAPDDLLVEAPETYDLIVRSKPAPIKATAPDMPPYDFTRSFGDFAQSDIFEGEFLE